MLFMLCIVFLKISVLLYVYLRIIIPGLCLSFLLLNFYSSANVYIVVLCCIYFTNHDSSHSVHTPFHIQTLMEGKETAPKCRSKHSPNSWGASGASVYSAAKQTATAIWFQAADDAKLSHLAEKFNVCCVSSLWGKKCRKWLLSLFRRRILDNLGDKYIGSQ